MNLIALKNAAKGLGALVVNLSLPVCSLQAVHDCGWTLIALLHSRAINHFRLRTAFKVKSCSRFLFYECTRFCVKYLGSTPTLLMLLWGAGLANLLKAVFQLGNICIEVNVVELTKFHGSSLTL